MGLQKVIGEFSLSQMKKLLDGKSFTIQIGSENILIEPSDVQIERKTKEGNAAGNLGDLTVVLDTLLNDELLLEGLARELVNKINTMRREMDFEVTDRIELIIDATPRIKECFDRYRDYIINETLTIDTRFESCDGTSWDLNGEPTQIFIQVKARG